MLLKVRRVLYDKTHVVRINEIEYPLKMGVTYSK